MLHVMIDIETFGTKPWSVIRSIGAVSFDPRDPQDTYPHEFYVNVDRVSSEAAGMVVEKSVEEWWTRQSQEAQHAFDGKQETIEDTLDMLSRWYRSTGATTIWAHGSAFDFPILDTAYSFVMNSKPPWHYRRVRDTRSAYHVLGFDYDSMKREGVYHNALADCKHQTSALKSAMHGRHR